METHAVRPTQRYGNLLSLQVWRCCTPENTNASPGALNAPWEPESLNVTVAAGVAAGNFPAG